MITGIWHGRTTAAKSDEYLNLMRTVAIPDYRSIPGNKGAYALRRIEGDTAHFLMLTFWESEDAVRAFAGDDISVAKCEFDKSFLSEVTPGVTGMKTACRCFSMSSSNVCPTMVKTWRPAPSSRNSWSDGHAKDTRHRIDPLLQLSVHRTNLGCG
jgi:hypothetical protein